MFDFVETLIRSGCLAARFSFYLHVAFTHEQPVTWHLVLATPSRCSHRSHPLPGGAATETSRKLENEQETRKLGHLKVPFCMCRVILEESVEESRALCSSETEITLCSWRMFFQSLHTCWSVSGVSFVCSH